MDCSLILASGSNYKTQLMARLGLDFSAESADIDETALPEETPVQTAVRLARQKARAVADAHPRCYVIGADQTIDVDGARLKKPGSIQKAVEQLQRLSGQTHRLTTAVCVVAPDDRIVEQKVVFAMEMRELTDPEIDAYVHEDTPIDCAGSYKIEAGGIRLFRSLRGDDYTAIIGLPLTRVWNILEKAGYFTEHPPSNPPSS
jgi:septum formation protein